MIKLIQILILVLKIATVFILLAVLRQKVKAGQKTRQKVDEPFSLLKIKKSSSKLKNG